MKTIICQYYFWIPNLTKMDCHKLTSCSFAQSHQTISLIHGKMIETRYEDTTQTTTFWILAETFIHIIYILQLQRPVHRLNMEISMSQRTNETIQTIMDTMLTTTFWILAKTSCIRSADNNVNNQLIGLRWKLWYHRVQMKQLKQPCYRLTARMFWH